MKTLLLAILAFASRALGGFTLQEPQDFQVIQRDTRDRGSLRLRGHAGVESFQYRLLGQDRASRPLDEAWRDGPAPTPEGAFDFQVAVPAGGWYRLEIRLSGHPEGAIETAVEHVGIGEVFLVAGQSNSANHGATRQHPESGRVSSFDGEKWRLADDPQGGASGSDGSFIPALGDLLVEKLGVPIAFASIGQGGTSVREWLPAGAKVSKLTTTGGGLKQVGPAEWESDGVNFQRLVRLLIRLGPGGLRAILWHQGESDAGQARAGYPASRQITGEEYVAYMSLLIRASRAAAGWEVPWFTAQATYHSEADAADEEFRAAQEAVWKSGLAYPGPDTDALRGDLRAGVHFNARGLARHGALWAEKLIPWLEGQLQPEPAAATQK